MIDRTGLCANANDAFWCWAAVIFFIVQLSAIIKFPVRELRSLPVQDIMTELKSKVRSFLLLAISHDQLN